MRWGRIVESVLHRLLHGLKHLLDQIQERLHSVLQRFRLVPLEVHDGLHAQNRIVLVLYLDQAHQLVHYLGRVGLDRFDGVHGQAMQDLEHAVAHAL